METVAPYREIVELVETSGGESFRLCYQCGLCDVVCPWNRVRGFSMRRIVREGVLGLTEIEGEDIWRCTTCGTCPQRCPRGVNQIEAGVALRKIATGYGIFPNPVKPLRTVSASLVAQGNPLNEDRQNRARWAEGISVDHFQEGTEFLYFPCCYPSYDPRSKKVAKATARVLKEAGVDFGILGSQENCCGESIRKTGDEQLFKRLARENIKVFVDKGVRKIIASSPHCYHTFKNEYTQFGMHFHVFHVSQFLWSLVDSGQIKIKGSYPKKVAYHDPCYLGRHNGVFEEPRLLLNSIPGLQLVELPDNRDNSLCCGGGGGRIWMETPREERFSDLRLQQAVDSGAQVLVTACPYCITNFEDSRLNRPDSDAIEVKELSEVLQEVI
ncbi:MAG: (Fe-S)-binding protein [Thermodesulfobacteriota bacterium]